MIYREGGVSIDTNSLAEATDVQLEKILGAKSPLLARVRAARRQWERGVKLGDGVTFAAHLADVLGELDGPNGLLPAAVSSLTVTRQPIPETFGAATPNHKEKMQMFETKTSNPALSELARRYFNPKTRPDVEQEIRVRVGPQAVQGAKAILDAWLEDRTGRNFEDRFAAWLGPLLGSGAEVDEKNREEEASDRVAEAKRFLDRLRREPDPQGNAFSLGIRSALRAPAVQSFAAEVEPPVLYGRAAVDARLAEARRDLDRAQRSGTPPQDDAYEAAVATAVASCGAPPGGAIERAGRANLDSVIVKRDARKHGLSAQGEGAARG